MALPQNNELFIAANYLQTYFVDKQTGLPLAGGKVYFWQDNNRNNQKPVYQLTSAPNYIYTALPNPMTLSNAGTFVDDNGNDIAVFFYPYDLDGEPDNYYVQVFAAGELPPPIGTPMFTREAVPGVIAQAGSNAEVDTGLSNVLANNQFSQVLFDPAQGMSITYLAGITTTEIAPGWFLEITAGGGGTTTINRTSVNGNSGIPTNPPYTLSITPGATISSLILYQRLTHNPGIFASWPGHQSFINAGILLGPATSPLEINYKDSSGNLINPSLLSASNPSTSWKYIDATVTMPDSGNAQTSDNGYVDIQIKLNNANVTQLSSVQVVGMSQEPENVAFSETSVNEQASDLFYYYQPKLNFKPIPSYLIGWDFPLNPAQINGDTVGAPAIGANKSQYCWDQTILFQSVDSGFDVARNTNGTMRVTCDVNGQFALIQYLDQATARKILNSRLSVNISAASNVVAGVNGTVSLWYTKDVSLPNVAAGTNNSIVASLAATGAVSTQNGTWFEIPRDSLGRAAFNVAKSTTNSFSDSMLNGWDYQNGADVNLATYFAIVVAFEPMIATNYIDFNSISLCQGDIATRPAPQTPDEVLRECERFYEMSYNTAADVNTVTLVNAIQFPQNSTQISGGASICQPNSFTIFFNSPKRVTNPTMSLYSPANAAGAGFVNIKYVGNASADFDNAITAWTQTTGNKTVNYQPLPNTIGTAKTTTDATTPVIFSVRFHYVADARLGIVL